MHGHEVRRLFRASSGAFGFAWRCPQLESSVRWERDGYGRVTRVDYGGGETETFAYDRWGRLSERTRGRLTETYRYDHFGRLAERDENGAVSTYAYDAWGRRTSLRIRHQDGTETAERRAYDRFGRLSEISSFGSTVKYRYDAKGRVSRQTVAGTPIDFAYDRLGRLAGKWLGGRGSPDASVEYEYSTDGRIAARTANGVRQAFEYDARGQLVAVREGGAEAERYAYDRAGNMVRKTVRGKTVEFAFDGANQLVSSTSDGVTVRYAYDAAGRLVREGGRAYRYGYLDKVLSVTEGKRKLTYTYHVDGQLATADLGDGRAERFEWDGLALVRRGGESFICEPHVGGGNPIASSEGTAYLNDMLGTTVAAKSARRCSAAALTAFGEPLPGAGGGAFFTGKPQVEGLGYAFLYRNYRPDLAKWQTADPLGYPDGWNQFAYCRGMPTMFLDLAGCAKIGDVKPHDSSPNIASELLELSANGYSPSYERIGFNTNVLNPRYDVMLPGSAYLYERHDTYSEYWAIFQDLEDFEVWEVLDVYMTISNATAASKLSGLVGTIGDIGGWIGLFLQSNPWYDVSMSVAQAIGKLEASLGDSKTIKIGQVLKLYDQGTRCVRSQRHWAFNIPVYE